MLIGFADDQRLMLLAEARKVGAHTGAIVLQNASWMRHPEIPDLRMRGNGTPVDMEEHEGLADLLILELHLRRKAC